MVGAGFRANDRLDRWLGLVVATTIVLSNLAGVAVDFFYLFIAQITGQQELAALADNLLVNITTCCVFIALAVWICCRGMGTTMTVQYGLVALQLLVLIGFAFAAFSETTAPPPLAFDLAWFNPFGVESFSAFAAGLSLSIFIFWGWDVCLTVSEESIGSDEVRARLPPDGIANPWSLSGHRHRHPAVRRNQ